MPPQMDAFSTPLNAGGHGGGFGGPGPQQNFGSPNMGQDGFMRNSNSNFAGPNREGVIINSRTQDGYYN